MTSADAIFTIRKVADPAVPAPVFQSLFDGLESVEALDARRFRVRVSRGLCLSRDGVRAAASSRPPLRGQGLSDGRGQPGAARERAVPRGRVEGRRVGGARAQPGLLGLPRPLRPRRLSHPARQHDGVPPAARRRARRGPDRRDAEGAGAGGPAGSPSAAVSSSSTRSTGATWRSTTARPSSPTRASVARSRCSPTAPRRRRPLPRLGAGHLRARGRRTRRPTTRRSRRSRSIPRPRRRLLDEAGWRDSNGNGTRDRDGREFEFELLDPGGLRDRPPGRRDARRGARPRRRHRPRCGRWSGRRSSSASTPASSKRPRSRWSAVDPNPGPVSLLALLAVPAERPQRRLLPKRRGRPPDGGSAARARRVEARRRSFIGCTGSSATTRPVIFLVNSTQKFGFDRGVRGRHDVAARALGHLARAARAGGRRRGHRRSSPGSRPHDPLRPAAPRFSRCRPSSESSSIVFLLVHLAPGSPVSGGGESLRRPDRPGRRGAAAALRARPADPRALRRVDLAGRPLRSRRVLRRPAAGRGAHPGGPAQHAAPERPGSRSRALDRDPAGRRRRAAGPKARSTASPGPRSSRSTRRRRSGRRCSCSRSSRSSSAGCRSTAWRRTRPPPGSRASSTGWRTWLCPRRAWRTERWRSWRVWCARAWPRRARPTSCWRLARGARRGGGRSGRHAFPNAILPLLTLFGLLLPALLSGSVIVERIFAWPGLGRLYFDSILVARLPGHPRPLAAVGRRHARGHARLRHREPPPRIRACATGRRRDGVDGAPAGPCGGLPASGRVALAVVLLLWIVAACSPLFAERAGAIRLGERLAPPSAAHPFGTDDLGRDLFARVVCATPISLAIGLVAAAVSLGRRLRRRRPPRAGSGERSTSPFRA